LKLKIILLIIICQTSLLYGQSLNGPFLGTGSFLSCSGSIAAFSDYKKYHFALFITNGHCTRRGHKKPRHPRQSTRFEDTLLGPYEVIKNVPSNVDIHINNHKSTELVLKASELVLATMYKKDLAIYKLKKNYGELLESHNIEPFLISSSEELIAGETIVEMISGLKYDYYQCKFSGVAPLVRESKWAWHDVLKMQGECSQSRGGNSGSPLVIANTRKIVGLHNSRYHGGTACSLFNPCEEGDDGQISVFRSGSYGQSLDELQLCRDKEGRLNPNVSSCPF
jgi:hypothetical protein